MPRKSRKPEQPSLTPAGLVQALQASQDQRRELEARLATVQAQRRDLEAQVGAALQSHLGLDLAPAMGRRLGALPISPTVKPREAVPAALAAAALPAAAVRALGPVGPPTPVPPAPVPVLELRGVNYYPGQHGWWRMWVEWDAASAEINTELDIAAALGINVLRTFLPFSLISDSPLAAQGEGAGLVPPDTILAHVDDFLDRCANRGIGVIMGLFDEANLLPDLVDDLGASLAYVTRVLNFQSFKGWRFGDDPRIRMWDLVNEFDDGSKQRKPADGGGPLFLSLAFGPQFPGGVQYQPTPDGIAWLFHVYAQVLALSTQDVTISAINPFGVVYLLQNGFDDARHVPQYHEYTRYNPAAPQDYIAAINRQTRIIMLRTNRRPFIGELGNPSGGQTNAGDSQHPVLVDWTPEQQQETLDLLLDAAVEHSDSVRGALVWTLVDWNYSGAPGEPENHYGLYTSDLQAKPAAASVQRVFTRVI